MYILGISAYYHNSAAALIIGGVVVAAAEEERFTRIKFDSAFPHNAVAFCLAKAGITLADVEAVVYYEKPLLKFERIAENFYSAGVSGYKAFIKYMPLWSRQKLFMRNVLGKELKQYLTKGQKLPKQMFSNHHLSHAASTFYCSPFDKAAIITLDGVGEWATASIALGEGNTITTLKEMNYPYSVGLLYSAFTQFLGFEVNNGEYKLMGLAPYGNKDSEECKRFKGQILEHVVEVNHDGSIKLDMQYFDFPKGFSTANIKAFEKLFGIKERVGEIGLSHCNLAMAIQLVLEDIMLIMAAHVRHLTGADYLCMAGGVALNCVSNSKILTSGLFKDVFIQPAAGDAGGALGAALAYRGERSEERGVGFTTYLGPEYGREEVLKAIQQSGLAYTEMADELLFAEVAKALAEGKIIGFFTGAMEWGPRALGNRSILADARNPKAWGKLNQLIKQRENFRPFAPVVVEEDASLYFEGIIPSPYMLFTFQLKEEWRLPVSITSNNINDRLNEQRSQFPAITHVDYSARVQTVNAGQNLRFYQLLQAFKAEAGHGMLVNTSFNRNNEPIVCTPEDAINCYKAAGLDVLVMGDFIVKI
jgi:carbamoyltransferase